MDAGYLQDLSNLNVAQKLPKETKPNIQMDVMNWTYNYIYK